MITSHCFAFVVTTGALPVYVVSVSGIERYWLMLPCDKAKNIKRLCTTAFLHIQENTMCDCMTPSTHQNNGMGGSIDAVTVSGCRRWGKRDVVR